MKKAMKECPKNLHDLHSDLPFLPERMKINAASLYAVCMRKKLCCSCKKFKTSIKSWSSTKKSV